eukprot:CAMPEP_0119210764 /NCGR_PEP_ID=MMETSP1327-20130426/2483_1 /TAXON_ID=38833 /ORGANISM="Micromonas pusilla, Strain RCC2306" /LENGTH=237 /DNA_ID=CAMNT_0007207833 /DNA_START=47 /DNA_END=760 /DNA_ORIENTATION=+
MSALTFSASVVKAVVPTTGARRVSARRGAVKVRANMWPEPGTYPGAPGADTESPLGNDDVLSMTKAAEYEVIHGRWAMLAIPGIVAQEQATGIPWYETGALCTPTSCLENYTFPGAPAPLAPEGSGLPSFWAVVAIQVVALGLAEAYRGGLTAPPKGFPEPSLYPGGRFDPFKLAEKGDLEKLKLQELKHCRLAMGAFLGCLAQHAYTGVGPVANVAAHVNDPTHVFFGSNASLLPQ